MKTTNCIASTIVFCTIFLVSHPLKAVERDDRPKGITFEVDTVEIVKDFAIEFPLIQKMESQTNKRLWFLPEEHKELDVVYTNENGFLMTINESYAKHRPLVLTPDVVWLAITQGASQHIQANIATLESEIFVKDKPKKLLIQNDDIEKGSEEWAKGIKDFSLLVKKYSKSDAYSFFIPQFSTTTSIHTTAYQATMLEAFKDVFEYHLIYGCGIPYITLTGEKADWKKIYSQLDYLEEIDMAYWADELRPIIQQFINTFDNKVDKLFWQDIYKNRQVYMTNIISGWILKFFPYTLQFEQKEVVDVEQVEQMRRSGIEYMNKKLVPNPFLKGEDYLKSDLTTKVIPSGLAEVCIHLDNYYESTSSLKYIYAGFVGAKQYNDKSIEPFISWCVCHDEKPNKN